MPIRRDQGGPCVIFAFIVAGISLLFWNEKNLVDNEKVTAYGREKNVPIFCSTDPAPMADQLIAITGKLILSKAVLYSFNRNA